MTKLLALRRYQKSSDGHTQFNLCGLHCATFDANMSLVVVASLFWGALVVFLPLLDQSNNIKNRDTSDYYLNPIARKLRL